MLKPLIVNSILITINVVAPFACCCIQLQVVMKGGLTSAEKKLAELKTELQTCMEQLEMLEGSIKEAQETIKVRAAELSKEEKKKIESRMKLNIETFERKQSEVGDLQARIDLATGSPESKKAQKDLNKVRTRRGMRACRRWSTQLSSMQPESTRILTYALSLSLSPSLSLSCINDDVDFM
jgi:chromosome segregation ATPase